MAQDAPKVRFGGYRGPRGYVFELSGGHLALDLANTLDERRTPEPRELLGSYDDLVAWGVQAGAVDERTAVALRRAASREPSAAARSLRRARALREEIFAVFSAAARGHVPPADALDRLGEAVADALARRRLAWERGGPAWVFPEGAAFERVLWPALVAAGELLTNSEERARVRVCEGEGCAWLFVDRSRNGSRRWCDMTVCGNRVKARRHYARSKEGG